MQYFEYKVLSNVLSINKKFHTFAINTSPLCSFCNLFDERPCHIFYECELVKCVRSDLVHCFQNSLIWHSYTLHKEDIKTYKMHDTLLPFC